MINMFTWFYYSLLISESNFDVRPLKLELEISSTRILSYLATKGPIMAKACLKIATSPIFGYVFAILGAL